MREIVEEENTEAGLVPYGKIVIKCHVGFYQYAVPPGLKHIAFL